MNRNYSVLLRLVQMALLIALGVVLSYASAIPVLGARIFPGQHAINVVAGAVLGPWAGAVVALGISGIRIGLATGTLLAIPGSVFGVMLAGLLYRKTGSRLAAMAGEVIGTGVIGALVAYPIAVLMMGNAKAAAAGITFFILPFASSSVVGAVLGGLALAALERFLPALRRQGANA